MIYFKIWEKPEFPHYEMKSRLLDLTELEDFHVFEEKIHNQTKFMINSVKNITIKDKKVNIGSIILEEIWE